MVDWDLAVSTGMRLVKPGPVVSHGEARQAVADLRAYAAQAHGHVAAFTGLDAPTDDRPGQSVVVIDRPGWIKANAAGFRTVLEPLIDKLQEQRTTSSPVGDAVGSKVTGVQTGSLLAFLATKVLGQYELFPPYGVDVTDKPGRLLLVAPNIVAAERKLGVDPADFRLWVCLHEVTHQLQFTAVPWLRAHLESEIAQFVEATDLSADVLRERLQDVLRGVVDAVRGSDDNAEGLMALIRDPAQRAVLDRVTAVMSLVEGHAEYVMDGVGPDVVPSVRTLRKRFAQRRKGRGPLDRVLRRLLGLEQKMKQYAEGRVFVGGVIDLVGMEGFNRVWEAPANLPLLEELTAPERWVERVLGRPAIPA